MAAVKQLTQFVITLNWCCTFGWLILNVSSERVTVVIPNAFSGFWFFFLYDMHQELFDFVLQSLDCLGVWVDYNDHTCPLPI